MKQHTLKDIKREIRQYPKTNEDETQQIQTQAIQQK
jgi:hypothetical protein